MNDLEKRKKAVLKKIEKLGILDIDIHNIDGSDSMSLIDIENVVGIVEKHNKEYPPEYEAAYHCFIKNVRENVWTKGDEFSRFYFGISSIIFWGLRKQNIMSKKCSEMCEKMLDIEKLYGIYKEVAR